MTLITRHSSHNIVSTWIGLLLFCANISAIEVRHANEVLELDRDARGAALAGVSLGMKGDESCAVFNPACLHDLEAPRVRFSHAEHFAGSSFDVITLGMRSSDLSAFALSLARFSADGIPLIDEDEVVEGSNYRTFSVVDWVLTAGLARSFGNLHAGASLHLLYRKLDQEGAGIRTDLSVDWTPDTTWRFSALLRRIGTSSARWESGTVESAPPDLYLGFGWEHSLPYFYGKLALALQSRGVFQNESHSQSELSGSVSDTSDGIWELAGADVFNDPWDWAGASSLASEFRTDFGLKLRAGFRNVVAFSSWTAGAGLELLQHLEVDYAYRNHPDLGGVHRVSLSWRFGDVPTSRFVVSAESKQKNVGGEEKIEPANGAGVEPANEEVAEEELLPEVGRILYEEEDEDEADLPEDE